MRCCTQQTSDAKHCPVDFHVWLASHVIFALGHVLRWLRWLWLLVGSAVTLAEHLNHFDMYSSPSCEPAGERWRDPFLHASHSNLEAAYDYVSPVMYKGQCIGSVARIRENGLLVSSTHIFVEKGSILMTTAFGGHRLQLVASFPYLDIILLEGKLKRENDA